MHDTLSQHLQWQARRQLNLQVIFSKQNTIKHFFLTALNMGQIFTRGKCFPKKSIYSHSPQTLPSFSFQLKRGQKKHSGPTLSLKSSPMKRMFPNVRRFTWVSSSRRSFFFISSSSSCSEVHIKRAVVRDYQHSKLWLFWPPWQVKTIPRN